MITCPSSGADPTLPLLSLQKIFSLMPIRRSPTTLLLLVLLAACSEESGNSSVSSTVTVVPIRLVGTDPVIEVKINGVPFNVQFDIGISSTVAIFPIELESIDKQRVGSTSSGLSMSGPTGKRPIYKVGLLEVGDIKFWQADVVEDFHDEEYQNWFSSRLDAHGFIGTGLFDRYKMVIDYPGKELTLIPPDAPTGQQALCEGIELPLVQGEDWGLISNVETDDGRFVLVWDTGSPESGVLKRRTDLSNLNLEDGDIYSTKQFIINDHDIGPETLVVWDWSENSPPFDGFIGYDFFAENVVCVDLLNYRIVLPD